MTTIKTHENTTTTIEDCSVARRTGRAVLGGAAAAGVTAAVTTAGVVAADLIGVDPETGNTLAGSAIDAVTDTVGNTASYLNGFVPDALGDHTKEITAVGVATVGAAAVGAAAKSGKWIDKTSTNNKVTIGSGDTVGR